MVNIGHEYCECFVVDTHTHKKQKKMNDTRFSSKSGFLVRKQEVVGSYNKTVPVFLFVLIGWYDLQTKTRFN